MLVKDGVKMLGRMALSTGFKNVFECDNLIILEKKECRTSCFLESP
jgi:hypothetical protein